MQSSSASISAALETRCSLNLLQWPLKLVRGTGPYYSTLLAFTLLYYNFASVAAEAAAN